jgi:hypothetical protein
VSPRAIIRSLFGVEWQFLFYGVSALVLIGWVVMVWAWSKKKISVETLLLMSIPAGYWFSPYFSNYDLLPIAAVLFIWLAAKHPKLALGFYSLHFGHWMYIVIRDYGPGIVQAAPIWILFTGLIVALKITRDPLWSEKNFEASTLPVK